MSRAGASRPRAAAAGSAALGWVAVLALASVDGGFFPASWPWATIGLGAAAGIALLLRPRVAVSRPAIAFVCGFAVFAGLVRLSALWADAAAAAAVEAQRAVVYVAGALAAAAVATRTTAVHLLGGVAGAATSLCVYTIVTGTRVVGALEGPIGYANALGILAVIGLLAAAGVARAARRPRSRLLLATPIVPLALALAWTGSRGSVFALAAGVAVALAVTSRTKVLLVGAATGAVAVAAFAAVGDLTRLVEGDRPAYWRVAVDQFQEHPVVGAGAGAFHRYWERRRPDPETLDTPHVLDAHSLYLETLAELGIVGLALVVAVLSIPLVVGIRRRDDPLVAVSLPAYVAFAVHAGVDWDWEMPAVTLAGIFCGVAVLAAAARDGVRPLPRWAHAAAAAVALALVASGLLRLM